MPVLINAEALPGLLKPGMTVFVQGASGEPVDLIKALEAVPSASAGIRYVSCQIPGVNRTDFAGWHAEARATGLFLTPETNASYQAGKVRLMPLSYSGMDAYLRSLEIDLALIQVRPSERKGMYTLGSSVHFVPTILDRAKCILAEVNASLPRPTQSIELEEDRLDYIVETDHPLPSIEEVVPSSVAKRIAAHIAGLVDDGDHLQVGIGKVPNAVLKALASHRKLRCHGGIVSEAMIGLYETGVLDLAHPMVCTSVLGTKRLYDWADGHDHLQVLPVSMTHDVRRLAALDNLVAINSVLSIDLSGQANAESVDGRQVGGSGGLTDFVRGANLATHGRSILALPSTARNGSISRIVASLRNDVVSCVRIDADYVVTEHGVADLRHKSLSERAKALIDIADPAFQQELGVSRSWF